MKHRIHTLTIQIANNENDVPKGIILIDGREFLDLVRETELSIAGAAGEPELAGKYGYLSAKDVLHPSRQLMGQPNRPLLEYDDGVSVLECECGIEGCWPLVARIEMTDKHVRWREFRQPHRKSWAYPAHFQFTFDRMQFEAALKQA